MQIIGSNLPIKNITRHQSHFTERRPSLLRVGVEAHQVELVHLAEVDAHAGAEAARQPLHEVAPVRVEEARVRVDDLVDEVLRVGRLDAGAEEGEARREVGVEEAGARRREGLGQD